MKTNKIIYFVAILCFIIAVLLSCIDFWAFNDVFYAHEFKQNNTAESIGINDEDLNTVTEHLLGYIKDQHDDLTIEATIQNQKREVFNEKEKLHMVDVKNLYQHAMMVRNIAFVIFILGFIINKFADVQMIYTCYKKVLAIFLGTVVAISFYAFLDFSNFWVNFHYLFFTNDLFFLDPNTDILIQIVPERFFFDLVAVIIVSFVFILGLAFYGLKKGAENR